MNEQRREEDLVQELRERLAVPLTREEIERSVKRFAQDLLKAERAQHR